MACTPARILQKTAVLWVFESLFSSFVCKITSRKLRCFEWSMSVRIQDFANPPYINAQPREIVLRDVTAYLKEFNPSHSHVDFNLERRKTNTFHKGFALKPFDKCFKRLPDRFGCRIQLRMIATAPEIKQISSLSRAPAFRRARKPKTFYIRQRQKISKENTEQLSIRDPVEKQSYILGLVTLLKDSVVDHSVKCSTPRSRRSLLAPRDQTRWTASRLSQSILLRSRHFVLRPNSGYLFYASVV